MLIFGKKLNFSSLFWFLFYLLIFVALLKNSYSYLDPDMGWHLKAGQHISLSGEVSRDNFYNYTFSGEWINHEWLADYLSFEVYNNWGYLALSTIFALVIVCLLVLLNISAYRLTKQPILIAVVQIIGLYASLPHFGIRMQEFGVLFLFFELAIISAFRRKRRWQDLFWLLPLFFIWVNFHGSFLFGLAILIFWIIMEVLEKALMAFKRINSYLQPSALGNKDLRIMTIFLGLVFLVTLLNPYGLDLYSFLVDYKNTAYLSLIKEWLPLYVFPIHYLKLIYLGFLSGAWIIYLYEVIRERKSRVDWWQFVLFVLFLALSFKSKRNFPLAFIATLPYFIKILSSLFDSEKIKLSISNKKIKYLLFFCLILSIISLAVSVPFKKDPFKAFCNSYPCKAVKFLQNNELYDNYRIFNEYGWGGYLIWAYPEKPLFIDGRLPQAPFAGQTFIEEYGEFFNEQSDKDKKLAEYDIRLILLRTKDDSLDIKKWEKIFFRIRDEDLSFDNHLKDYLNKSLEWGIIYQDEAAIIYIKK